MQELAGAMAAGDLTAADLVAFFLKRIDDIDRPRLHSVIEVNPDAEEIARELDRERRERGPRGPLHGIPVILKDNIDTGDRMQTSAGSLALVGDPAPRDSTVAERLRRAGAVILGKANLSEWANWRSTNSISGWSGRGGLVRCPYALDRNPSGSSSGSGASVSAGLCTVAIGTETDGSIASPANACGVVGLKPSVGYTSRSGVVPISHTQDTVGPMARHVADAAITLAVLGGADPRDPATLRFWGGASPAADRSGTAADGSGPAGGGPQRAGGGAGSIRGGVTLGELDAILRRDGLRGARIGVLRDYWGRNGRVDAVMEEALRAMREAGATLVDPASLPTWQALQEDRSEFTVLLYEFHHDIDKYLATRTGVPVSTLADLIEFNRAHADREMPLFGQELFEMSLAKGGLETAEYVEALERSRRMAGPEGIDAALAEHRLDALVAPTGGPAAVTDIANGNRGVWGSTMPCARAGYPLVTVPAGEVWGLPVGITFMAGAGSEATLLRLAYAFEQATKARRAPRFLPTIPIPE